jgi:hypothetical protein
MLIRFSETFFVSFDKAFNTMLCKVVKILSITCLRVFVRFQNNFLILFLYTEIVSEVVSSLKGYTTVLFVIIKGLFIFTMIRSFQIE